MSRLLAFFFHRAPIAGHNDALRANQDAHHVLGAYAAAMLPHMD